MKINTNKQIKSFYADNKISILALGGLFVLWRFWDVLSGLLGLAKGPVDAAAAAMAAATAGAQASSQAAKDKVLIKASLPVPVRNQPQYQATSADTVRYRAAADALAVALGTKPGQIRNVLFTDDASAYATVKPYGKQMLGAGGKAVVSAAGAPVLRPATGRYDMVLAPVYRELTGGSLQADLDGAFPSSPGFASSAEFKARCNFYRKHIRV